MNKNKVSKNFGGGVTDFFLGGGPSPPKKNGPAGNPVRESELPIKNVDFYSFFAHKSMLIDHPSKNSKRSKNLILGKYPFKIQHWNE